MLEENDLAACICFAPEHLYYLTGYEAHTHFSIQAAIFGPDSREPVLIVRDVDRRNCDICWIKSVRTYRYKRDDPAELIAATLSEHAAGSRRIGVGLTTYALPGAFALHLLRHLSDVEIVDASRPVEQLRSIKSPREIAYIRRAAAIAEAGLRALREAAAPGPSEIALAGRVEAAMRNAGSDYCAMPTWLASGPRSAGSHRTPSPRVIRRGDAIRAEFGGVCRRYHAVTMQTLWVGEVGAEGKYAYEGSLAALRAGSRAVGVGVPVATAEEAAFAALQGAGFSTATHFRFGYGVSAAYPPTWLEGLDITTESEDIFAAGMTFVLHAGVIIPGRLGTLVGGAYLLGEHGLELLSGGDLELTVV